MIEQKSVWHLIPHFKALKKFPWLELPSFFSSRLTIAHRALNDMIDKKDTFFFRFWFHFTVENTRKDQRVIFNVVNLSKNRSLFAEGLTPVVKSTTRPRWQRMLKQNVFHYKSPLHHEHFVLSFAFTFDRYRHHLNSLRGLADLDFFLFRPQLSETMVAKYYGHKNVITKSKQKDRAYFWTIPFFVK